jgi:uncharacterized membrane protein YeaQ/YmgE (transglycosylase-associated protein family)
MSILLMIVIGLIVGGLAKLLMPGPDPGGMVVTLLLGISGSILAAFIGRFAGWYVEGESAGFIASVVGAVALLIAYRAMTAGSRTKGIDRAA